MKQQAFSVMVQQTAFWLSEPGAHWRRAGAGAGGALGPAWPGSQSSSPRDSMISILVSESLSED